jgi:hypothetical protein
MALSTDFTYIKIKHLEPAKPSDLKMIPFSFVTAITPHA